VTGIQVATWVVLCIFALSRLLLFALVVAALIAVVRILREPRYVPDEAETEGLVPL
jgi:hypothetical protein